MRPVVKTLDEKYYLYALATIFLLVFQFIPVLNLLVTLFIFFFVIVAFYKKWVVGFIPILSLSFLHGGDSVSIYTLKMGGLSLFYILIFVLFALKLYTRKRVSIVELTVLFYLVFYIVFSTFLCNFYEFKYYLNDMLFLIVGVMFLYVVFDFKDVPFDKLLLSLSSGYFIAKIIVYHTGVGLQVIPYSQTVDQYSAVFDPIENFLIIYNVQAFIFPKVRIQRSLALFNVLLFFYVSFLLGYMHGATIMLIFFVLLYNVFRNIKVLFSLLIFLSLLAALLVIVGLGIESEQESVFLYKVEKIFGLFQFFYDSELSIYDLPRSTQVRLIETANLLHQNWLFLLFGNGFGGYITEVAYSYGNYLNQDDYSLDQILSGKYQVLHAYNQVILKHGLLSIAISGFYFYFYRDRSYRNFRDMALLFVVFSYSFTIKPYLILALFVLVVVNEKGCEVERK